MTASDQLTAAAPAGQPHPDPAFSRPTRAVILAGGKGLRANPYTSLRNKCLFVVHDHSLIEGQIAILRDQLGVRDIVVLVGHLGEQVRAALGDGAALGVRLTYVEVPRVEDGPARGLLAARGLLTEPFYLFLGDEYYHQSRHAAMLEALARARAAAAPDGSGVLGAQPGLVEPGLAEPGLAEPSVLFTYIHALNPHQILANFSIDLAEDGRVRAITEKPARVINDICGCGTLYLTPEIFDRLERAAPSPRSGRVELYEVAASYAAEGRAWAVDLRDPDYVNINTMDDLRRAVFTYRSHHFSRFKLSVVVPAWNEAHSIRYVVRDFLQHPQVAEVVVMDNHSEDGTGEIARQAGARVIPGRYRGYGDAIRQGLNAATGDILVVTEADYSFRAADLPKLLEYLKDADVVVGTRTTRQLIAQGANMAFLARTGNMVMAKYMELIWFWLKLRFSDVGCSYRAVWRNEWQSVEGAMRCQGPDFAVEMIIEMVKARKNCIEVPVSYHPRFGGESKHSKDLLGLSKTAWKMWKVITGRWLQTVANIVRNWLRGE